MRHGAWGPHLSKRRDGIWLGSRKPLPHELYLKGLFTDCTLQIHISCYKLQDTCEHYTCKS